MVAVMHRSGENYSADEKITTEPSRDEAYEVTHFSFTSDINKLQLPGALKSSMFMQKLCNHVQLSIFEKHNRANGTNFNNMSHPCTARYVTC